MAENIFCMVPAKTFSKDMVPFIIPESKDCFIRRILVASNVIQTVDNYLSGMRAEGTYFSLVFCKNRIENNYLIPTLSFWIPPASLQLIT